MSAPVIIHRLRLQASGRFPVVIIELFRLIPIAERQPFVDQLVAKATRVVSVKRTR
jgi:hypothetical protein